MVVWNFIEGDRCHPLYDIRGYIRNGEGICINILLSGFF